MSCALIAMLEAAGIKAYPALVLTRDAGLIDRGLVVPRFNHMIVYIPDGRSGIWVDPTAAPCPLGYLPPPDRDVEALVIKDTEALWLRTPDSTPFGCKRSAVTRIILDSLGNMRGTLTADFSGDFGFRLRNLLSGMRGDDLARAVESEIGSYLTDVSLSSCEAIPADRDLPVVTLRADFERPRAAVAIDDRLAIRLDFLHPLTTRLASIPKGSGRTYPLRFYTGWTEEDTVYIEIPEGWEVVKVPGEWSGDRGQAAYSIRAFHDGRKITVITRHSIEPSQVRRREFEDFTAFWAEARTRSCGDIVLRSAR
jgi:hypothetical protein